MTGIEFLQLIVFFSPVIVGAAVAIFKLDFMIGWMDSLGGWIFRRQAWVRQRSGFISRWFLRPFFWGGFKIFNWTDGIKSPYSRAGVRVAAFAYFVALFINLAIYAAMIIIMLIIAILAIWIAFTIVDGGDRRPSADSGSPFKGKGKYKNKKIKVDEKGNMLDAESIYPWKVGRVTDDGRVVESNTLFGTDGKVKADGDIEEDGLFGGDKIGHLKKE